jgi:hypothetical protein
LGHSDATACLRNGWLPRRQAEKKGGLRFIRTRSTSATQRTDFPLGRSLRLRPPLC